MAKTLMYTFLKSQCVLRPPNLGFRPLCAVHNVHNAAGPIRLWNSLPGPLRQAETLATFKRQLFLRHFCFQISLRHLVTP